MNDLKQQAEELGVKIDGRWSDDRIQQEIDKALEAPSEPKKEPFGGKGDHDGDGKAGGAAKAKLPVRLLRGYVPLGGGGKVPSGKTIELPSDEARTVVASGIAVRADAF